MNNFHLIINNTRPKKLKEFYPRTVVYEFNNHEPIAVDVKFLYERLNYKNIPTELKPLISEEDIDTKNEYTWMGSQLNALGFELLESDTNHVVPIQDPSLEKKILFKRCIAKSFTRFKDIIDHLIWKYGLKHEYYKNEYGYWVDIMMMRLDLPNSVISSNPILRLMDNNSVINDNILESSIYRKLGDSPNLDFNFKNSFYKRYNSDVNVIPKVDKYYVGSIADKFRTAWVHQVDSCDGKIKFDKVEQYTFVDAQISTKDNFNKKNKNYAKFKYQITNYIMNSDEARFAKDLRLTFEDADGQPFEDLDNMLIFCNGLIVDYVRKGSSPNNEIYLLDVVKFAKIQPTSSRNPINHTVEDTIYSYTFDISIHKWEGIGISHFTEPLAKKTILKEMECDKGELFWLTNGLQFQTTISKDNCILIENNTIIPQTEWDLNPEDPKSLKLTNIEREFDLIFFEIYKYIEEYNKTYKDKLLKSKPILYNYLKGIPLDPKNLDYINAIKKYNLDMQEFSQKMQVLYKKSPMRITEQQFKRSYNLIHFFSLKENAYDISLRENRDDIFLNHPYKNKFVNKNWHPNDITIFNGQYYRFPNEYQDVFIVEPLWYRYKNNENVLDYADAYKIEIVKNYKKHNIYRKLTMSELYKGPIKSDPVNDIYYDLTYYVYNKTTDEYIIDGTSNDFDYKFESKYIPIPAPLYDFQPSPNDVYFYYDSIDKIYKMLSKNSTEFHKENGVIVTHYHKHFLKDYYIRKK